MQAIQTKYLGPTNHRGARIKATCDSGSVTVSWDYSHNVEDNHRLAAEALSLKLGWLMVTHGTVHTGSLPDGSFCHVFVK